MAESKTSYNIPVKLLHLPLIIYAVWRTDKPILYYYYFSCN